MNQDLKDLVGQLDWGVGYQNSCRPFTPPEDSRAAFAKLRNPNDLAFGCKIRVVWKQELEFIKEEWGKSWEKHLYAASDEGILIGLPGYIDEPFAAGIFWCFEERHEGDEPFWQHIRLLLCNDLVEYVEVIK